MSSSRGGKQPSGSVPDDGWTNVSKKSKNKAANSGAKQYAPQSSASNAQAMSGHKAGSRGGGSGRGYASGTDSRRPSAPGRYNGRSPAVIAPPLQHGWNWSAQVAPTHSTEDEPRIANNQSSHPTAEDIQSDENSIDDSEDELLSDYDSDASDKSHGTRKKNPWFKELFDSIDKLSIEELNDPERQWHCPACKGGPGAIDWYKGLRPLRAHAKTRRSKRANLHKELAELLEEELRRRGTAVEPRGEAFGKWNGLKERDFQIVWPPMVIITNTLNEKDDDDKWTGMGNQELLDTFRDYSPSKSRHSYGPQGHRGMSVLIFDASAVGYYEAERLSKDFSYYGRDREAWLQKPTKFCPGGVRQLYGYMAEKKDIDVINQHSPGNTAVKFEMKSYREMVVNGMKQMSEDAQQQAWYKNEAAKHQKHAKALEEAFSVMGEKYRQNAEDTRIVISKMKSHHEHGKEEKEFLEEFYKEKLKLAEDGGDDDH